jgi:hypothetical protein
MDGFAPPLMTPAHGLDQVVDMMHLFYLSLN